MEASRVFNNLINQIEKSQLNFKITKTPFAANISLKSSFIRYFEIPSPHSEEEDSEPIVINNLDTMKLLNDLKIMKEENVRLEDHLKQEKSKVKSMEAEAGVFREEILEIKKDKRLLTTNLREYETKQDLMKAEEIRKGKIIDDLRNKLKLSTEDIKSKDTECNYLNSDKIAIAEQLHECKLQLEVLKSDKLIENSETKEIKCSHCENKYDSLVELSQHVRTEHFKHQVSQTRRMNVDNKSSQYETDHNFEVFPCFYCDCLLRCSSELEGHATTCTVFGELLQSESTGINMFPCAQCDFLSASMEELLAHMNNYHSDNLVVSEHLNNEDVYTCDFCCNMFGTLGGLRSHIRSLHKEMLPT